MAKSIIQDEKVCMVCGSPYVHEHHIFGGTANRKVSEKYGLKCYLCPEHHVGNTGVHFDKKFDLELKRYAQLRFNEEYDEDFRKVFGKSYL